MAIVDNRTLLDNGDAVTNWDNIAGTASGTQNTDTFIQGTACVGVKLSATLNGLLFDAGSAQDWSNNHFYFWWNVLTAGLLDTKAGGGVRMRFCGATVTDFFEVYIEGKDTYTGGFIMSVVDIETARSTAITNGWTGGTPPATSAIRYVGIVFDVTGMLGGNFLNCLVDACWRLPANTPGIRVEGQNAGPVDWTWGDIVSAGDVGDATKAWGSVFRRNGVIFLNTPVRFGANDATTHGFSDTSEVIAWEDQLVSSTLYNIEIIGGSGTQSFSLGTRVGSGDASVGHSGCVFTAASAGKRYAVTASDANIDKCEFLGCTFSHTGTVDISNALSEIRSSLLSDGSAITHADAGGDGVFQKNTIVAAATADGVAYITTDDPSDIKNTAFVFSDGHAVEITAIGTYTFSGNTFSGYGAGDTNDAAIYNNSGGAVTLNITGGGDTPTVRNGTGASTTINNAVILTVTVLDKSDNGPVPTAQVAIFKTSDNTQLMNEDTTTITAGSFVVGVKYRIVTVGTTDFTLIGASSNTVGVVFTATGAGSGTGTASNGIATESFNFVSDTPIYMRVRKSSTGGTKYIPNSTTGTITSSGFTVTITLTEDTNA